MFRPKVKKVVDFSVFHLQFVDKEGKILQPLPEPFASNISVLVPMYKAMLTARELDRVAINLQRTGQLGTYAPGRGHEAIGVGVVFAMKRKDCLCPAYREATAQFERGVEPSTMLNFWACDPRGNDFTEGSCLNDMPNAVPVASQCLYAVGIACDMMLDGAGTAVVCCLGDGATSKGDFYGSINFAGVWKLPIVYVINNNKWAISVPLSKQTAAKTLAQKAIAAGIPDFIQVDGNDVIAVHYAVDQALKKAREGGGPAMIEALTYRLTDHTTADDASQYRDATEVAEAELFEPISRTKQLLLNSGVLTEADDEHLKVEIAEYIAGEVKRYKEMPPYPPEKLFDHLYAKLPRSLVWQREEMSRFAGEMS